jgi:hypothetical protein
MKVLSQAHKDSFFFNAMSLSPGVDMVCRPPSNVQGSAFMPRKMSERQMRTREGRPATANVGKRRAELTIGDILPVRAWNLRDFEWNQEHWKIEKGRLNAEEKEIQRVEREKQRALEEEYAHQQHQLFLQKTAVKVKEVQEALKNQAAGLISALRQIDVNGDGEISQREFCSAVSRLQGISVSQAEFVALYRHLLARRPAGQGNSKKHLTIDDLVDLLDIGTNEGDTSPSACKSPHENADATQDDELVAASADACGSAAAPAPAPAAPKHTAAITPIRRGWSWRMQLREKHLARAENKDYVTADEKVAARPLREKTAEEVEEEQHMLRKLYNEHLSLPASERKRLIAKGVTPYSEDMPFRDGYLCNVDSARAEKEVLMYTDQCIRVEGRVYMCMCVYVCLYKNACVHLHTPKYWFRFCPFRSCSDVLGAVLLPTALPLLIVGDDRRGQYRFACLGNELMYMYSRSFD